MSKNSNSYKFYIEGGVVEITDGETVLKMRKIWWFYHLVASIVTNKEGNSDIANGDKKKSYEGRWWIETPSRELIGS